MNTFVLTYQGWDAGLERTTEACGLVTFIHYDSLELFSTFFILNCHQKAELSFLSNPVIGTS